MYEHAARTWAYQQKAWFGRESKVFYDAKEKRWICHVLDKHDEEYEGYIVPPPPGGTVRPWITANYSLKKTTATIWISL